MTGRSPAVDLTAHADHVFRRLMQDLISEATGAYRRRRADQFAAVGTTQCDAIALACRRHPTLVPFPGDAQLVEDVLAEVE